MFIDHFTDYAPAPENCLVSLGALCQAMQVMPRQLKLLMDEVKIVKFAQVVDGVGYFTATDAEMLCDLMAKVKKEVADSVEAAPNN